MGVCEMKIKVYARTTPEAMIEAGEKAGLSEKAANYFRHFHEVELELEVTDDGDVRGCTVLTNLL